MAATGGATIAGPHGPTGRIAAGVQLDFIPTRRRQLCCRTHIAPEGECASLSAVSGQRGRALTFACSLELEVGLVQLESLPNAEVEASACFAWLAIEDDPVVAA